MVLVSVVIPTYNRPGYLRRAVESVLAQSYEAWEVLIVQNGTNDAVSEEIQHLCQRDKRIRHLTCGAPNAVAARNYGIEASKGDYIAFLDDDDEWLSDKMVKQVNVLDEREDVGLVTCAAYKTKEGSGEAEIIPSVPNGEATLASLVSTWYSIYSLSLVMVRKRYLRSVGGFDARYSICNDLDLYTKLIEVCSFYDIEEPLVRYHVHADNATWDRSLMYREVLEIAGSLYAARQTVELKRALCSCRTVCAYRAYSNGREWAEAGDYRKAMHYIGFALLTDAGVGMHVVWSRNASRLKRWLSPYVFFVLLLLRQAAAVMSCRGKGVCRDD